MTKKLFLTLSIITLLTSCSARRTAVQDPATFDEGVVINGIRWATRNVDMPGTFAASPESPGMFFQWNRKKGWNAIDEEVEGWDNSIPEGTTWYAENDPCPAGWRVPTREELQNLFNSISEIRWVILNGINGHIFGDAYNQIFFPAAGVRVNGTLYHAGYVGFFWGSSSNDIDSAQGLMIVVSDRIGYCGFDKVGGFSIRCVAK